MCLGLLEPLAGARSSSTTIGVSRQVLGDDHLDTLVSTHNIGSFCVNSDGSRKPKRSAPKRWKERVERCPMGIGARVDSYRATAGRSRNWATMRRPSRRFLKRTGPSWPPSAPDHERTIKAVNALADPHDAWHEAEPDQGHDAKAAEWRAKLEESHKP